MIFNVSVGDFICLINLIIQILGALEQSHGAAPQFQDLMGTFESLKEAIKEANALDGNSEALSAALKRAEGSVERFLKKVEKFQLLLSTSSPKAKWKDVLLKVQWALLRKEDVNAFRAEIYMHLNSIQLLLLSACRTALVAERKEILDMRTYMMSADARMNETRTLVATLNSSLSHYAAQLRNLLQCILRTNVTILNTIIFARFRVDIPMSVCWDQPVNFQDATGRRLPINVGFVNCWESFQHALINIHKNRPGFQAVENYNYRLQDASTCGKWSEFQPSQRFEEVFAPGGFIDMTVIFPYDPDGDFECPKCGWPEGVLTEYSKIECPNRHCDLNYSKSDYLQSDMYTLPAHFELPPIPVVLSEAEKAAAASEIDGEITLQSNIGGRDAMECVHEVPSSDVSAHVRGDNDGESIANFRNVYISKPAMVTLRDHHNIWYNDIPWRVAQFYKGIKFIIDHYTPSSAVSYCLRDREVGWKLNESNWRARAWPGMVILVEPTSSSGTLLPRPLSPTREARCLLCRKIFGSGKALRKHTVSTHLYHHPCPGAQATCPLCAENTI